MAHEPTEETRDSVKEMCVVGIPQDAIAKVVGIDAKTLRAHYREELDTAMTKANTSVGGKLYQKCMDGDTTAMIFWCKTRLKWKEITVNEIDPSEAFMAALKEEARKEDCGSDREEFDE